MAHSPSPSPAMFSSAQHNLAISRRRTPSPPLLQPPSQPQQQPQQQRQPLSKRDKRRAVIEQRLKDIITTFSRERDAHTRHQLNTMSRDIQAISRADLYYNRPLDDNPEDLVTTVSALNGVMPVPRGSSEAETQFALGQTAVNYVNDVNDEMEKRDAAVTEADLQYRAELAALHLEYEFSVAVAEAEFQTLKEMAKQKIVSSIQLKKRTLQKEKDQLDTADSTYLMNTHALTALAAPGSPSGGTAARKTRHSRLRGGDEAMDGVEGGPSATATGSNAVAGGSSSTGGSNSNKRRRKGAADLDESPGPSSRSVPFNSRGSMLWEPTPKGGRSQQTNGMDIDQSAGATATLSTSSPERFFTARELKQANATAHATVAHAWTDKKARKYLLAKGLLPSGSATGGNALPDATPAQDGSSDESDGPIDYSALVAPAMDRSGSHATRSTRLNVAPPEPPPVVTAEGLEEMDDPRRIYGLATLEAQAVRARVTGNKDVEAPLTKELSQQRISEDLAIIQSLMDAPE